MRTKESWIGLLLQWCVSSFLAVAACCVSASCVTSGGEAPAMMGTLTSNSIAGPRPDGSLEVAVDPVGYWGDGVGRIVGLEGGEELLALSREGNAGPNRPIYSCVRMNDLEGYLQRRLPSLPGLVVRDGLVDPEWAFLGACLSRGTRLAPAVVVGEWDGGTVLLVDEFSRADDNVYNDWLSLPASAVNAQKLRGVTASVSALCSSTAAAGRVINDDGVFAVCEGFSEARQGHVEWQRVELQILVDGQLYRSVCYSGEQNSPAFLEALVVALIREIGASVLDAEHSQFSIEARSVGISRSWVIPSPAHDFSYRGRVARACAAFVSEFGADLVEIQFNQDLL